MLLRKSSTHTLKYINEIPYLISYGQAHSEQGIDHKLNDSSATMWQLLDDGQVVTDGTIVSYVMECYELDETNRSEIESAVEAFIKSMMHLGLVKECNESEEVGSKYPLEKFGIDFIDDLSALFGTKVYDIADFKLKISSDTDFEEEKLAEFEVEEMTGLISQEVTIVTRNEHLSLPVTSREYIEEHTLIDTSYFKLIEYQDTYSVIPKDLPSIHCVYITKDARKAVIVTNTGESQDIFLALRIPYLYLALLNGRVAVHSASILYDGKAWLFSGASGTGKSTHTNMWRRLYDVSLINGDINLIGMGEAGAIVYGLPWCGTSGEYTLGSWPLGGIVFLKQGIEDKVKEIEVAYRPVRLLHRLMSPLWTEELLTKALEFSIQIASENRLFELECTMNDNAAIVCKCEIDRG